MNLGTLGERLQITCRQGASLGPFTAKMRNADGTPVDLTGSLIRGTVRRTQADADALASIETAISDPTGGVYMFGLSSRITAGLPAGVNIQDPNAKLVWDLELVDSQGRVTPLYYGPFFNVLGVTREPVPEQPEGPEVPA